MRNSIPIAFLVFFFGFFVYVPVASAGDVNRSDQQDDVFLLQARLKNAQSVIAQKDLAAKDLVLEKSEIKNELASVKEERDRLLKRVEDLQKTLLEQEKSLPDKMKKMTDPFQEKIDELTRERGLLKLTIEQKDQRINRISGEEIALQAGLDNAAREKSVLMAELKKTKADLEILTADFDHRLQRNKVMIAEKARHLQSLLLAERAMTAKKIRQVQKPLEDKVVSLGYQIQAQDVEWRRKMVETRSFFEAKIKDLETKIKNLKTLLARSRKALVAKSFAPRGRRALQDRDKSGQEAGVTGGKKDGKEIQR